MLGSEDLSRFRAAYDALLQTVGARKGGEHISSTAIQSPRRGHGRWKHAVTYEKQQEKLQAYLLYKGSKKLDLFLVNWSQRKLRQAWTKWWSAIVHEKALERSALELNAIQVIQRSWRAYRGRMFAYLVKMQKLIAKQTTAAIKMQRMFRGVLHANSSGSSDSTNVVKPWPLNPSIGTRLHRTEANQATTGRAEDASRR